MSYINLEDVAIDEEVQDDDSSLIEVTLIKANGVSSKKVIPKVKSLPEIRDHLSISSQDDVLLIRDSNNVDKLLSSGSQLHDRCIIKVGSLSELEHLKAKVARKLSKNPSTLSMFPQVEPITENKHLSPSSSAEHGHHHHHHHGHHRKPSKEKMKQGEVFISEMKQREDVVGFLKLTIIEARDLPAMDLNGKSDPFVVFRLSDSEKSFKTQIKKKTLSPVWNETALMPITNKDSKLMINVFDWDFGKENDYIGSVELDLDKYMDYQQHEMWLTLSLLKHKKLKTRGDIHIKLKLKNKQEANRKIFGTAIEDALLVGDKRLVIPELVEEALSELEKRGIDVEGIGRVAGRQSEVDQLMKDIDQDKPVDLSEIKDIHTVSGLLKLYLRSLPEPLVPFELYDPLLESLDQSDPISFIVPLFSQIQNPRKNLLKRMLLFFYRIAQKADVNKMPPTNIATVFSPSLMYLPKDDTNNLQKLATDAPRVNSLFTIFIQNYPLLSRV